MPTTKKRVNITIPDDLESSLKLASQKRKISESAQALKWMQIGAELDEDLYFLELAESRLNSLDREKPLSHNDFWKKALDNKQNL